MALEVFTRMQTRQRRTVTPIAHIENGFPHHSSIAPELCICLDECCNGPAGCKCKSCMCSYGGRQHGYALSSKKAQFASVGAERTEGDNPRISEEGA
jgi:hypothetical protein